ncbi:MAG: hypothetical protein Q9223_005383 [Gallowayella weberi]
MKTARSVATTASLRPDTYIYHILPINTQLVSVSSDDALRVIDPQTLNLNQSSPGIHDGITCLGSLRDRDVLTAGRDGLVKWIDLRSKDRVIHLSERTELTNSQATVTVWDSRATKGPLLQYVESHNDDVTDLSFHPSNPTTLLSGSTDGLVNLYDTTISDEDDALTQVFNHGSSIAHAGFLSDHHVFALSHDEIFSIYNFTDSVHNDASKSLQTFGDLRAQLQCEYIVDLHGSNWTLDTSNALRLPNAHGDEVVRSMCFSKDEATIFTAGEDGLIKAWRSSEDAPNPSSANKAKYSANTDKKRRKHNSNYENERPRFNPY